jgi:fatty acid desaturase (delta-4 desaturase)
MPPIANGIGGKEPAPVPVGRIRIEDKLYSTEKLSELHPGGPLFIKVVQLASQTFFGICRNVALSTFQSFSGRDASQAFISYHRRSFPHSRVKSAFDSVDTTVDYLSEEDHTDFMELCDLIAKVVPRLKSWAPWQYYAKIAFIWCVAVGLELYQHCNAFYWWPLSVLTGLFVVWMNMNIMHDANHGAISGNPYINQILGLSLNYTGGSSANWIHQHCVQHHIHTNDVTRDPDMKGNGLVRLNPLAPLMKHQGRNSQMLLFFLLTQITDMLSPDITNC